MNNPNFIIQLYTLHKCSLINLVIMELVLDI